MKGTLIAAMLMLIAAFAATGSSLRSAGIEYAKNIILENDNDRENRSNPRNATRLIAYRRSGMVGQATIALYDYLEEHARAQFMPITLIWKNEQRSGLEALLFANTLQDVGSPFLLLYTPEMMIEEIVSGQDFLSGLSPIAMFGTEPVCFAVRADSPYTRQDALLRISREKLLRLGGISVEGGLDELRFRYLLGVHDGCPYQSVDPEIPGVSLEDGTVDVLCLPRAQAVEAAQSGKICILPYEAHDVLSVLEDNWICLMTAQSTQQGMMEYWDQVSRECLNSEAWRELCEKYGWQSSALDGEEIRAFLQNQMFQLSDILWDSL